VSSLDELAVIINHFDKCPLLTQKRADFELFKIGVKMLNDKSHLTIEGLGKFIALRASVNLGLSPDLKASFPNVIPVQRPLVKDQQTKDPQWLAGFVSGDGCFLIKIQNSSSQVGGKIGANLSLKFQITQHSKDEQLMKSLVSYLGCGRYEARSGYPGLQAGDFVVTKFSDIAEKIIPFFNKYPIRGVKALDFADFSAVAEIIKNKDHLTPDGLGQIRIIKAGMNKGR